MKAKIHPNSIVHPKAFLGDNVEVGPYTTIGRNVVIGKGTKILSGVYIEERTIIGQNCQIYSGAVLGVSPQDFKYKDEKTFLKIGNNNVIRECVTIHRSTGEKTSTIIGNGNYLMAYSHIAHNCYLGNGIVMANAATLGGHVKIDDNAIVGGLVGVHQFVNIGKFSLIGGCSKVTKDVLPFAKADGHPLKIYSLNTVGLKRHDFPEETINILKHAFRILFRSNLNTTQAIKHLKQEFSHQKEVNCIIEFIQNSKRGITK